MTPIAEPSPEQIHDAIVVGAGPAGLTAAIYLARFRRRVLVLGGGPSRASWIPQSHNTPGFSQGVSGVELLDRLVVQATRYGAAVRRERVTSLTRVDDLFIVGTADGAMPCRSVVLATGVLDRMPPLAGLEDAIRQSTVRMCPICDAYEAIGKSIAVLGDGDLGAREATFLTTYSDAVTLLRFPGEGPTPNDPPYEIIDITLGELTLTYDGVRLVRAGGSKRSFDHLYLALGCTQQGDLAIACGAAHENGVLIVDAHQQTTVTGLYAAGDVVRGLNQIAVAAGEAAVAATAIHNRLRAAQEPHDGLS